MNASTLQTGGGAGVTGNVTAGTFIGRDQIFVISGYTGADLERVLVELRAMLATGRATLCTDPSAGRLIINAPDAPPVLLSAQAAEDLATTAARQADVNAYLAALLVHPRYGRWARLFVPLAGLLTVHDCPPGWTEIAPEFTLFEYQGEGAQKQLRRVPLDDITQAIAQHPALVLLGEPGSGKTTTLYKLALDAAQARLSSGSGKIPLYLPLAAYRGYASPQTFVAERWQQQVGVGAASEYLRRGEMLLLCDALNEMPFSDDRDYRARVQAWRYFVNEWPGNQVLFTCRSRDYGEPLGLHQVEIMRLDNARVREFLAKYVPAHAETAWARLEDNPLLELVRNPYYLSMLAFILEQGGVWPERPASLFANFVHVLLGREADRGHLDWPGAEPIENALASLAESLQPLGQGTRLPRAEIEARISADGVSPATVVRLGLAATLLDTEFAPDSGEQVRFYHHQLQEYFAAQALKARFEAGENLRARWKQPRLAREMPAPGPLGDYEPLPPPPTTGWEEPTVLAAGLVRDPAAFVAAVQAVNPMLAARCLVESRLELPETRTAVQTDLLRDLSDRRLHLRARIAAGLALGQVGDPRFEAVEVNGHRILLPPLVAIPAGTFQMGSSAWQVRWLALRGYTVARNELPRHPVQTPAFYMGRYPVTNAEFACFVEAGGYADASYWRTEAARAWLHGEGGDAVIQQWLQLWQAVKADPEKVLAQLKRAGVTPQQLEALRQLSEMDENDIREWARKNQAERPRDRPAYWDDARFNNPAQPVVGVTWFEAAAYCAWLTGQAQAAGSPLKVWKAGQVTAINPQPGTYSFRLPSETEWEKAARGGQNAIYPWGNRWDAARANTWEGHVLQPTPGGAYPLGVNAWGLSDMAGNVWQWTRSLHQPYPYREQDGRNDPEAEGYRVARGGSWDDNERFARCAYRYRLVPDDFNNLVGFRVVLSLEDSGS
ncbi:MAG TPA: SUMF1/EgtB/PvdO family nonheme iron enzyme [Anaerolineae bacterium]|nr:SUMF1/EgtB/PvdO family nonheme iron enzyme [Anaerolineae bacterium]HQJ12318.1 SUMF1/EgtB/PvdO family nonheme iron enzyme [Anaerolineae bacterium]HUM36092.1 SUMF1/EgtB/PvdO family nonheme iron enzyme [Anaerolineae bacterium]